MEDLQLVLGVLGAIAIIAVLLHGFWSIKKERQAKASFGESNSFMTHKGSSLDRDRDGFDEFGVGDVVVKPSNLEPSDNPPVVSAFQGSAHTVSVSQPQKTADNDSLEVSVSSLQHDVTEELFELTTAPSKSVRKEPVVSQATNIETKQDQIPLDLGDTFSELAEPEVQPVVSSPVERVLPEATQKETGTSAPAAAQSVAEEAPLGDPRDVLVLHLVAKDGDVLNGDELLPCLLSLNFKFGDMNIFHRHQDNAGTGKVLFSLANMVKPGIFDPDTMEQFTTPGVVLFLTLPCYGDPLLNFSNMLNSAQQLADDLGAVVLDGERQPWNEHVKLSYVQRIRSLQA